MTYVVVSKNEDGIRVFGKFKNRARAEALAASVNERIEMTEDANREECPDGYGRCGVLVVHRWNAQRVLRFALGELNS